jgi:hypothetical protein
MLKTSDLQLQMLGIRYDKSFEHLEFLTGDNCSVNKLLVEGITQWYIDNEKPPRVVS